MKTIKMKTINFKFALGILSFALLTSCNKDEVISEETVSEQEMAEVVINSVSKETNGLVSQAEKSAEMTKSSSTDCGKSENAAFTASNPAGSVITYSTSYNWNWIYNCNENVPANFTYTFSGSSNYETPRMSSNDVDDYKFVVSNLDASQPNFVINQSSKREGSKISKIQNQNSFTSLVEANSTNINVNKATRKIISGEVSIQVNATTTSGKSAQRSGTLIFKGNNSATLSFLNGKVYNFSW